MIGVYFFRFLKVIFFLSPFEHLHHSLFYLSLLFLTFLSISIFQMQLRNFLHFFVGSMFDRSVTYINVECRNSRSFMRLDSNAINSSVVLTRIRVAGYGNDMVAMVLFGVVDT